jgi:hypothetical protein
VSAAARPAWHVADWGALGWLETALTAAGMLVGVGALVAATGGPAEGASGARLAQAVLLAILATGLTAAILDRLAQREAIAMAFVPLNAAAHWCMAVAVARDPSGGAALVAFCALMLAGDLVKLVFLRRSRFTVRGLPPAVPVALTVAYATAYVALIAIEAAAG